MSLASRIFVHQCTKVDTKRDAGLTTPDDIQRDDNISYGPDKKWQLLDVYRPKDISLPAPVIVSVHGGGWVYGDKEVYQHYCMNLAQRGFIVVNFSYRLAPAHKFPAAVEDTNLVFSWLLSNAEQYGFDTDRIFALGDSAGAQILAIYACIATNPGYAKEFSFTVPKELKLQGLALNCGLYDVENAGRISYYGDFLKEKGSPKELQLISPAKFVTPAFPPSFLMTASNDFLKTQAPFMENALKAQGVTYRFKEYGEEANPLYHVFHCNIRSEDAKTANDDECAFFLSLSESLL